MGSLNDLHKKYSDQVEFLTVYILEAHPEDGWKMAVNEKLGIRFNQPKTFDERKGIADTCAAKLDIKFPVLIDNLDNKVENDYAGWPDRLYIVGKDGRIAYKGGVGPGGFKVPEMAAELEKVLKTGGSAP